VRNLDKYEYNLKFDQIKSLCADENYEAAATVADSVNWSKIRNVNALVKAGEVYEKVGRYDESREILLMAYDRSPIGRMIIYRLAELAIKLNQLEEADEYYKEFVEIAPRDNLKYVLSYEIAKAKGATYQELIPILEQFKEQEYTEEWSYELAYLYHKAGIVDKCVEACDELILWFGDGPFVERALELKMLYQPLTKSQDEKYRSFRLAKKGVTMIEREEMEKAGEYGHDSVNIPQVSLSPERFNTVNLQEEIAKGMQQILAATDKSTVADTMENIKKITQDIPYLQDIDAMKEASEDRPHIATDEEIDGSLKINFQELLVESDGQMSIMVGEDPMIDRQITGQMTIADVLEEWEKTKHAAEVALQEAEQRKLESAKARAIQEAEGLMERLNDVQMSMEQADAPAIDLNASAVGILPTNIPETEAQNVTWADMRELLANSTPEIPTVEAIELPSPEELESAAVADALEAEETITEDETGLEETPEIEEEPIADEMSDIEETVVEDEPIAEEADVETKAETGEDPFAEEKEDDIDQEIDKELEAILAQPTTRIPDVTMVKPIAKTVIPTPIVVSPVESVEPDIPVGPDIMEVPDIPEIPKVSEAQEPVIPENEEKTEIPVVSEVALPQDIIEDLAVDAVAEEMESKSVTEVSRYEIKKLSDSQKAVFSYFVPVKGMEDQLCIALSSVIRHIQEDATAASGNLIIQGGRGCGKTVLATSFIKVVQAQTKKLRGKVGKISGESLNKKDIHDLLKKVAGGVLIIERAGEITRETAVRLALLLQNDTSGLLIILEDTSKGIKKALSMDDAFASRFSGKVNVPIFTNDELVSFAKSYSEELGYEIDEVAVLALYNRISNIQKIDQATTLTEVKEIVDEAIDREKHGGLKKAISILTSSRYTGDDRIVLREKDFE